MSVEMELVDLSFFAVFSSLEQNRIVPNHIMTSRIEQLPIPLLLKQRLKSCSVKWGLQPILAKFTFEFRRTIDLPRQVVFDVYGFYGICGLFYDKKTKLLLEIQQNDCQEISVWCFASGHLKNDFFRKACATLRNLGVTVSPGDFKSRCYGKIFMQLNREMVLMEWEGDENGNWVDDILHWRNSTVSNSGIKLNKLPSSEGQVKLLSIFPVGCESESLPAEVSRELSLLDGITCEDVQRLQGILHLSDEHIFVKLLDEASECDKM